MTPEVLSNDASIQTIQISELVNYLQQNHWTAVSHPNTRLLVFEKGTDEQGKPIQVVLPSQDDYEDAHYLLSKVVNLLAVLKSVSFQEIANDIRSTSGIRPSV